MRDNKINNDLISIIIPTYNSEKFIKRCVDSVIEQTYKNIEIIIINDGSIDGTESILKNYNDKRIIIINKNNTGVSDSRNVGINTAKGKYITFVDADDWIDKKAIENMYNYTKKNKYNVIRTNYFSTDGKLNKKGNISYNNISNDIDIQNEKRKILNGEIFCYSYLLFIDKTWLKNNNIYFDKDLAVREDTHFYLQILNKNEVIYFFDCYTYYIYNNPNSVMRNDKIIKRTENYLESQKKIEKIINNDELLIISRRFMANVLIAGLFVSYLENKKNFNNYFIFLKDNNIADSIIKNTKINDYSKIIRKLSFLCYKQERKRFLKICFFFLKIIRKAKETFLALFNLYKI